MGKQEFVALAQELSTRSVFDIESVALFLETNFELLRDKSESESIDEKHALLLLDRDRLLEEIRIIKKKMDEFCSDFSEKQKLSTRLHANRNSLSLVERKISAIKNKKKTINVMQSESRDKQVLIEIKKVLKEQMGDSFVPFIQEIENRI